MGLPLGRWLAGVVALVWASAAQAAAPFEDSMAQRTLACTACHGDQGRAGPDGYYPRLAGKPAGYLYHQLLNFRDGRRHYGPKIIVPGQACHPFLASADLHFIGVLRQAPLPVDTLFTPHAIEGNQMAIPFSVGQHAVAIEDEGLRHALPSLPKILK